jgi:hypothetical protein
MLSGQSFQVRRLGALGAEISALWRLDCLADPDITDMNA